jgi:hypothetical protein
MFLGSEFRLSGSLPPRYLGDIRPVLRLVHPSNVVVATVTIGAVLSHNSARARLGRGAP